MILLNIFITDNFLLLFSGVVIVIIISFVFLLLHIKYLKKVISLKSEDVNVQDVQIQIQAAEIQNQKENMLESFNEVVLVNAKLEKNKEELNKQTAELKVQTKELELVNQELEKLSIVAQKTDNVVIIMDKDGYFEWVNPSFKKFFGYDLNNLRSNISVNIIGKDTPKYIIEKVNKCIKKKKTVKYEQQLLTKKKKNKWINVTLTPILDSSNRIKKLIAIDSDITELKIAEQEIKMQHRDIKAGIRYASTIQKAILPIKEEIDKVFNNFIFYKPKDIVSGDFYWFSQKGKYKFIAVVDCTGHGVPGAFMSVLGNTLLNDIVNDKNIISPSEILTLLHKGILKSLKQTKTNNTDGMDISLCRFEEKDNNEVEIIFAGARCSIYHISKVGQKIKRIRGDIKTVGGLFTNDLVFNNHKIKTKKDNMLYLATDGYIDQNSNFNQRKSFGTVSFMKLLRIISVRSLEKQRLKLEAEIIDFRNGIEQRDDITVIGIKI